MHAYCAPSGLQVTPAAFTQAVGLGFVISPLWGLRALIAPRVLARTIFVGVRVSDKMRTLAKLFLARAYR